MIEAYEEAKRNYFLGGHRLSAVEGGRFCEAAYRILENMTGGRHTPIGSMLDSEKVTKGLESLRAADFPKAVRIYLPRALRVVYDIRNSRDVAHLADGIDPNLQDATLVTAVLDWVMAEFVRLSRRVDADTAQRLVTDLVTRRYPVVQMFGERPKVLRADLRASDTVLVLLYHQGGTPTTLAELTGWVADSMRSNLRRTVRTLDDKALVHLEGNEVLITRAGEHLVESRKLLDFDGC
ncbi:hypothetical protein MUY14_05415 [Amycolatopsis sp. FBCC-B4732]|uniref:hypothetical protein n=1 Tax=Amycolatopsis sp. FBCC-B4732 TaxID=3079339 RepID=UPI001FF588CB|nr:hypothetical protein [Amycolatopsis sp. FBCC-B4732]UOX90073.1 hypothetical protein MUY14_05415 [Amycolatopsis sp. FBCC-B4732]